MAFARAGQNKFGDYSGEIVSKLPGVTESTRAESVFLLPLC